MKPIIRRGLSLLLIIACMVLWSFTLGMSRQQRLGRTCQGKGTLDVIVTDSAKMNFVGREEIEKWLDDEYRAYAGLPLDSVDLTRIERIVSAHSVVKDCEAWITDDGILHVQLSQRMPLVRFDDGSNAYYADAEGFIFPLQSRGSVDVPVVSGKLPLQIPRGYKGEVKDPVQKEWACRVLALVEQMQGSVWEQNIRKISARADGELILHPMQGKERFFFGQPVRIEEKLGLMDSYYRSVAPYKGSDYYSSVDLRYEGQLVCRQ